MLAGFEGEILKLLRIGVGYEFAQFYGRNFNGFPLVGFFLAHNALEDVYKRQVLPTSIPKN